MAAPPGAAARCPRCALRPAGGGAHCAACMAQPWAFCRTVAAFDYAPPADTLILMLKTRLRLSMAPVLAKLMAEAWRADGAGAAALAMGGLEFMVSGGRVSTAVTSTAEAWASGGATASVSAAAVSKAATPGAASPGAAAAVAASPVPAAAACASGAASSPAVASLPPGVLLVPIPASRASLRLRGLNPAAEIARSLAAELGLPRPVHLLVRRREAPRQATLGRGARQRGAVGLFECVRPVCGRHVAIVDDVMTTGSTANAAATALLAAGAGSVTVLVAARTP